MYYSSSSSAFLPHPSTTNSTPNSSSSILLQPYFPNIPFKKITLSLLTGSVLLIGRFSMKPPLAAALLPLIHKAETETTKHMTDKDADFMWERFLDTNPNHVEALKILVYRKMSKGEIKETVKYLERLIDLERDEVEWRLLEGLCYDLMGKYDVAKRLFQDILNERPLLVKALHGLAMVMHKNKEGPAVYEMLNEALELARRKKKVPEVRNICILIAQMYVVKGDMEEGLMKFQGLIDENPRDFRPYYCQGIILSLLDRKEEAEEMFMTYRCLVPEEFPQKCFLDDILLEAKTKSREHLQKDFEAQFPHSSSSAQHRAAKVP